MLQTGSGKTYTMGTGSGDGCQTGLIPQVMTTLFNKIEILKHQTEFQVQVFYIEVYYFCCSYSYFFIEKALSHVVPETFRCLESGPIKLKTVRVLASFSLMASYLCCFHRPISCQFLFPYYED